MKKFITREKLQEELGLSLQKGDTVFFKDGRTLTLKNANQIMVRTPRQIFYSKKTGTKFIKMKYGYIVFWLVKLMDILMKTSFFLAFFFLLGLAGSMDVGNHFSPLMWLIPIFSALFGYLIYRLEYWLDIETF